MHIEMPFSCITLHGLRKMFVEQFENNCSQLINLSHIDDNFKFLVFSFSHRNILHNEECAKINECFLVSDHFPLYIDDDYDGDTYYTFYSCCKYPCRFNLKSLRTLLKENSLRYRIFLSTMKNFQVLRLRIYKNDLVYLRLLDELIDYPDEVISIKCNTVLDLDDENGCFFLY